MKLTGLFLSANDALRLQSLLRQIHGIAIEKGPIADLAKQAQEIMAKGQVGEFQECETGPVMVDCPTCRGEGSYSTMTSTSWVCSFCEGTGKIRSDIATFNATRESIRKRVERCG